LADFPITIEGTLSTTTDVSSPWPRMVCALRHRDFRLFWSGNLASNVGTWMQNVAQGWLVLKLSNGNSAFYLGLVGFAASAPMLVFSLLGGVVADRLNRRALLMATQTAMMVFAFVLAALTWTHTVTIFAVVLLAFANGLAMSLNSPAYQAMQTELVTGEDVTNAIALNAAQYNMSRIVGPMLGGFCIAWLGIAGNFFVNGLSFLAVLLALMAIRYPEGAATDGDGNVWRDLAAGFRYVNDDPTMRALLTLVAMASICGIPYLVFVPLFARDILHLGERGFGLLMACSGVGALLGAAMMACMPARRRGRVVVGYAVTFTGGIVAFSLSHWLVASAVLLAVIGFSMVMAIANVNALLQQLSSRAMRGRVMSMHTCCFLGFAPIGSLVAGSVAKLVGAPWALATMAGIAVAGTIALWFTQPQLRKLD
jgi:MFS family permease